MFSPLFCMIRVREKSPLRVNVVLSAFLPVFLFGGLSEGFLLEKAGFCLAIYGCSTIAFSFVWRENAVVAV